MTIVESPFEKVRRKMVAARIELMSQLARFSQEELSVQPHEGGWSPLQIAHHLYITDGLALEQMQRVQEEDGPLLPNLAEQAPHITNSSEPPVSLEAVLAGMAARREEIFAYLAGLPTEGWERPFRHAEWGERQFYQLVNVLPLHDHMHSQQLVALKEQGA